MGRGRWSSWRAQEPARRALSRPASRDFSIAEWRPNEYFCSRSPAGPRTTCSRERRRSRDEVARREGSTAVLSTRSHTGSSGGNNEGLGLARDVSVLDPGDVADIMALLRDDHGPRTGSARRPRASTLAEIYSRCVNTNRSVGEVVADDFPWCEPEVDQVAELCSGYVKRKRARGLVDFDDLLLFWRAALQDEHLGPSLVAMFDVVLVDEYQDVNAVQADIVRLLRPRGSGLTVVGDDAQAIYGFRGADSRRLHELTGSLPDVTVVRLEKNFRSFSRILDLANAVRPQEPGARIVLRSSRADGRKPALFRCYDAASEARVVVDCVLDGHEEGMMLREQAVLVRASHHSDLIELELTARRIPYRKYGGLRFLEASHVKDFLATLRLLHNTHDEVAWFRLLRMHDGIGPASAKRLVAILLGRACDPELDATQIVAAAPARTRVALSMTLRELETACSLARTPDRVDGVHRLLRPLVQTRYERAEARLDDLERLASAARTSEDLCSWICDVTLDPPLSSGDLAAHPHLDEDYVVISTVHSAKGLEWRSVHLPHLVDGAFPSDMALRSPVGLAEERRLFYVATTRARDKLTLYAPLRMPHHRRSASDRHSFASTSRFLDDGVLGALEVKDQVPQRPSIAATTSPAKITVDLDVLWR